MVTMIVEGCDGEDKCDGDDDSRREYDSGSTQHVAKSHCFTQDS